MTMDRKRPRPYPATWMGGGSGVFFPIYPPPGRFTSDDIQWAALTPQGRREPVYELAQFAPVAIPDPRFTRESIDDALRIDQYRAAPTAFAGSRRREFLNRSTKQIYPPNLREGALIGYPAG